MNSENLICKCKKVSEEEIIEAIKNGATSLEEVKEKTGASSGLCRGTRCKKKINALIEEHK